MAFESQNDETFDPEPPKKKGMSTTAKVLITLGCVFGGFLLLCCGGVMYTGYQARNAVSEDPTVVAEVTKEIAEIDIPPQFQPKVSMNMDFWFMPVKMRFVVYHTRGNTGSLTLMEFVDPNAKEGEFGPRDRDQVRQQMRQQNQGQNVRDLDIEKSHTRRFQIRGKEVAFRFAKAVDPQTKTAFRQVRGAFPGRIKNSRVVLVLQLPEDEYNEDRVVRMIESIK